MKTLSLTLGLVAATAFLGGGGGSSSASSGSVRTYQATASVGDFLTIRVDPAASTISYTNHTNGQAGTVAYTVAADGAYVITTPSGGLVKAYEIPGFALVAAADNTGPTSNTTSLVTAILQAPISTAWLDNKTFNYMQWRTSLGGMSIGTMSVDGSGNANGESYWPFGAMQVALGVGEGASAWNSNSFAASSFAADPSGNFLTVTEGQGNDTVFATQGGFFVVDNPNGSIISLPQASSSAFDASTAGTYKALAFSKNATMGAGANTESGTGIVAGYTVTLSAAGLFTLTDAGGNTVTSQTIQPMASEPTMLASGTGELPNGCPGLFTYEVINGTVKQDVYVEFITNAILFCSYSYDTSQVISNPVYSYNYGVALKQ